MIKNDTQLTAAKERLARLEHEFAEMQASLSPELMEAIGWPFQRELERGRDEVVLYELLRNLSREQGGFERAVEHLARRRNFLRNVSNLLAQLRVARGLTQAALAERAGWQQSNVARYESEDYQGHKLSEIINLTDALEVELQVTPRSKAAPVELALPAATRIPQRVGLEQHAFEDYCPTLSDEPPPIIPFRDWVPPKPPETAQV